MKIISLLTFKILFVFSCSATITPKETVINFITSFLRDDFKQAQSYITEETSPLFVLVTASLNKDIMGTKKLLNKEQIIKDFGFGKLFEIINTKNAFIQNHISLTQIELKKENNIWKIVCTETFIKAFINEENLENNLRNSFSRLITAFQKKSDVIDNIILSTKNSKTEIIRNKIKEIKNLKSNIANIAIYNKLENELSDLITNFMKSTTIASELVNHLKGTNNDIMTAKIIYNKSAENYNSTSFFGNVKLFPITN